MKKTFQIVLASIVILSSIVLPINPFSNTIGKVQASNWEGWSSITGVYYNPAHDDELNHFVLQAATELQTFLAMTNVNLNIVTGSVPESGAIYLSVDTSHAEFSSLNDEAFHIYADIAGIHIIGKTPIAVRHGAYYLLEELGFRWYFKSDIWTIVPDSLISYEELNITEAPDYLYRGYQPNGIYNGKEDLNLWYDRNRAFGAVSYQTTHTYGSIYPYTNRATDPDSFVGAGADLNPYSENVINAAISYANSKLADTFNYAEYHDYLSYGSVSISPNDGSKWDPPWENIDDSEEITNAVYSLANEVAKEIYPTLAGVYSYSYYAMIPTIELEPNILAMVALDTSMSHTTQYYAERIKGLVEKDIEVGVREYLDIWQWYYDSPRSLSKCYEAALWYTLGAKYYQAELTDNWGGAGLRYYVMTKVLWDTSVDIDDLYDQFFVDCFGAASETMKQYWEVRSSAESNIAEAFRLLDQAEQEAFGDEGSLERIRYMECYTYSLWKRRTVKLSNLSDAEADIYYNFVTKTRDWYIDSYDITKEAAMQASLASKDASATLTGTWSFTKDSVFVSATDGLATIEAEVGDFIRPSTGSSWYQIRGFYDDNRIILVDSYGESTRTDTVGATQLLYKEVMSSIIDFSAPTAEDITTWMTEALSALSDIEYTYTIGVPDHTEALGDTIADIQAPLRGERNKLFFTANIDENVILKMKGAVGSNVDISIYYDTGVKLESYFFEGLGIETWDSYVFTPPTTGRYYVTWTYNYTPIWLDITNHTGASYLCSESNPTLFSLSYSGYIYVPQGTESFTIGLQPPAVSGSRITATLTDPSSNEQAFISTYSVSSPYRFTVSLPEAGLWKVNLVSDETLATREGTVWVEGIPPLIWHDPMYLLVNEVLTPPVDIDADVNADGMVNILDTIKVIQRFGESGSAGWTSEDINQDGIINLFDILLVRQYWTR